VLSGAVVESSGAAVAAFSVPVACSAGECSGVECSAVECSGAACFAELFQ
jgi:hypothetical protein